MNRIDARTRRIMGLATALLTAGALAGCGGGAPASTKSAVPPSPPPSIDDSSFTIVPPSGAPNAPLAGDAGTLSGSSNGSMPSTAPQGAADTALAQAGGAVTGASGAAAHTVPGIADGAVALPPSTPVAADRRCTVSVLRLEPLDLQGSPGGTYANFRLVNTSKATCAVRGYVGARLIGDAGRDLATTVRHEAGPDVWVQVSPKGSAQFHLRFPNPQSGETPCNPPNAARLRISVSSATGTLTGSTPEGGIQACNGMVSTAPLGST